MNADRVLIDLRIAFARFELDVDLNLPGRGVTVLFGQSGSGKTSLLRCVAGLDRGAGRIIVKGETWQDDRYFMPTHKRPLGYVFQEANLFPHLTVRRNLQYGLQRLRGPLRTRALDQAVELLGIDHLLDRRPQKLSGGERQRVAIAQALAMSPQILMMDEPMAALDQARKQEVLPYLERLHDELRIPVLYVTHSTDELMRLADYLVLLEDGKPKAQGPTSEVMAGLDFPINLTEEAGVVFNATIVDRDTRFHLALVDFSGGQLWIRDPGQRIGSRLRLRVMARDVSVAVEPAVGSSILNMLPATIEAVADGEHPAIRLLRLKVGDTSVVSRLSARSTQELNLTVGRSVWLNIKTVALLD